VPPMGLGMEDFAYPYPVHTLDLTMEGQPVRMSYMDVAPDAASRNGRTVVLMHGRNFFGAYWARTIEVIHAAEVIRDLLHDPDLQDDRLVLTPPPGAWTGEGVGVVEAPRGTLLHHYRANESGEITSAT